MGTTTEKRRESGWKAAISSVHCETDWLVVSWADSSKSRYPAVWLRDNIPEGRHSGNGQRLFDISSQPEDIALGDAMPEKDGAELRVRFEPEGLESVFTAAWLQAHCLEEKAARDTRRLWDARHSPFRSDYEEITRAPAALLAWLKALRDDGVALLRNVPTQPGSIFDVVRLFGYVRETNYGRLFDVVSEAEPVNLAYSNLGLGLHTDNPYRDPAPGLQLLHCLVAESDGGESVVVDGFAVAERLRSDAPEDFELLIRHPVPFAFTSKDTDLRTRKALIELDCEGRLAGIRYNNRSAAALDLPPDLLPEFYRAYRRFGRMLHDPDFAVSFRLTPGDLFVVDNRRVLHGRKGFSGGRRHLQGCYADKDALESKIRVLEAGA